MDGMIKWDPQKVADIAQALSEIGNEYRSTIAEMYYSFNCLGINQKWVGKNFNSIANDVLNSSKNTFEEWADYLQYEIPKAIFVIAQTQSQNDGSSLDFALYNNSDEIRTVDDTFEKSDGSCIMNINQVKKELNENFIGNCYIAKIKLQEYYSQFEELEKIKDNMAISIIYEQLWEILEKNKKILQAFQENVEDAVELSIQNIELANYETQKMVDRLFSILR